MAKDRKPRVVKQRSEAAQNIINEGKAKLKEAQKLCKIVDTINDVGAWGLDQLTAAIEVRRAALEPESPL